MEQAPEGTVRNLNLWFQVTPVAPLSKQYKTRENEIEISVCSETRVSVNLNLTQSGVTAGHAHIADAFLRLSSEPRARAAGGSSEVADDPGLFKKRSLLPHAPSAT